MSKEKDFGVLMRVDKGFQKLVKKIARIKFIKEGDKKLRGSRRITMAMARHPLVQIDVSKDIIEADLDAEGRK